jgi:predicted RNA methylase
LARKIEVLAGLGRAGLRPVGEIGAGAERLALGAQDDGADVVVAVERLVGVGDLVDQRVVEVVVRRALDLDDADMAVLADADVLLGRSGLHGFRAHLFPPAG